jgi:hypothetical protein
MAERNQFVAFLPALFGMLLFPTYGTGNDPRRFQAMDSQCFVLPEFWIREGMDEQQVARLLGENGLFEYQPIGAADPGGAKPRVYPKAQLRIEYDEKGKVKRVIPLFSKESRAIRSDK